MLLIILTDTYMANCIHFMVLVAILQFFSLMRITNVRFTLELIFISLHLTHHVCCAVDSRFILI